MTIWSTLAALTLVLVAFLMGAKWAYTRVTQQCERTVQIIHTVWLSRFVGTNGQAEPDALAKMREQLANTPLDIIRDAEAELAAAHTDGGVVES